MRTTILTCFASFLFYGDILLADNMCAIVLRGNEPNARYMVSEENQPDLLQKNQLIGIVNFPYFISSRIFGFQNYWKLSVSTSWTSQNSQILLHVKERQWAYQISCGREESLLAFYFRADLLQAFRKDTDENLQRDIDATFGFGSNDLRPVFLKDHSNGWSKFYVETSFLSKSLAAGIERNITRSLSLGGGFQYKLSSFNYAGNPEDLGPLFDFDNQELQFQKAISHISQLTLHLDTSFSPLSDLPAIRIGARADFTFATALSKERSSDNYNFIENSIFDSSGSIIGKNFTARAGLYLSVGGL